jgi:hypothetical protein
MLVVELGLRGFETLKLDWNWTLSLDEALANGPNGTGGTGGIAAKEVVVLLGMVGTGGIMDVEVDLGIAGIGLAPVGLTVACILAREDAVGAYNLEEDIEVVGLTRAISEESTGGAGAGRAFLMISA